MTSDDSVEVQASLDGWSGSLPEAQHYVLHQSVARGFDMSDPALKMLLLTEEVGELAKAVRCHLGMPVSDDSSRGAIADELADVMFLVLGVAAVLEIDVTEAMIAKERRNASRQWSR